MNIQMLKKHSIFFDRSGTMKKKLYFESDCFAETMKARGNEDLNLEPPLMETSNKVATPSHSEMVTTSGNHHMTAKSLGYKINDKDSGDDAACGDLKYAN